MPKIPVSQMEFRLRDWTPEDQESLLKFGNNFQVARFMTDQFPHPYTPERARAFIEFAMAQNPKRIFCIEVNGEAAGGIGLHPKTDIEQKNAELGYWLAEPYWGHGIMSRAIAQVVEYGFKTFPVTRIIGRTFGNNPGSQRALQKAGFVLEGRFVNAFYKNGEFTDEVVYAVRTTDKNR